jgi:hypothetical protein
VKAKHSRVLRRPVLGPVDPAVEFLAGGRTRGAEGVVRGQVRQVDRRAEGRQKAKSKKARSRAKKNLSKAKKAFNEDCSD